MTGSGGLVRRTAAGAARPTTSASKKPAQAPKHHGEHPSYKSRRWAK